MVVTNVGVSIMTLGVPEQYANHRKYRRALAGLGLATVLVFGPLCYAPNSSSHHPASRPLESSDLEQKAELVLSAHQVKPLPPQEAYTNK